MTRQLILIGAIAALAACTPVDRPKENFGDAVRRNMAAQIINPQAGEAVQAPYDLDGRRAGGAMQRYQEGKTYDPRLPNTSKLTGDKQGGGR